MGEVVQLVSVGLIPGPLIKNDRQGDAEGQDSEDHREHDGGC